MGIAAALINFFLSAEGFAFFVLGFIGACLLSGNGIISPRAPLWSFASAVICFIGSYVLRTYVGIGGGAF